MGLLLILFFIVCPHLTIHSCASEQDEAQELFNEGMRYRFGKNQDIKKAIEALTKAAGMQHLLATYLLAQIYEEGIGAQPDINKAIDLYVSAAEQGFTFAQFHLGQLYRIGEKVKQDYKKSIYYYSMASNNGDKWAPYFLGLMHEYGNGVPISYDKAIYHYKQAANKDNVKAQNALGRVYEHKSEESPDNLVIALKWYIIGATRHNESLALNNSERLTESLSKEQIAKAKQFAQKWLPKEQEERKDGDI